MERLLHVPILIQLVEAVKVQQQAPNAPEADLRLEISSPSTNLPGYYQAFQRNWVFPVSTTGILQLQLLPSKYLQAPRLYRVRLYRLGNPQPDFTQSWEVPAIYKYCDLELVRSSGSYDDLPVEVFAGVEIPGYEGWHINGHQLVWGSGAPSVGTAYSLRYLLPLSLADVVKRD